MLSSFSSPDEMLFSRTLSTPDQSPFQYGSDFQPKTSLSFRNGYKLCSSNSNGLYIIGHPLLFGWCNSKKSLTSSPSICSHYDEVNSRYFLSQNVIFYPQNVSICITEKLIMKISACNSRRLHFANTLLLWLKGREKWHFERSQVRLVCVYRFGRSTVISTKLPFGVGLLTNSNLYSFVFILSPTIQMTLYMTKLVHLSANVVSFSGPPLPEA